MHEIDIKTTVGAMTNELAEQTELFDMLRVLGVTLRIASLVLLLWVGFAYSRQLVAEVARHKRIHDELGASQRALRDLAAHQEAEINAERKRMAQEIHDELGQRLTVLRMDIALLPRAVASDPTVLLPQRVRALKIDIDAIMTIVREVASRLRPEALEVGLSAAAESLLDEFQQSMGIPCELDNQLPANLQLDEARLTTVFRILQESLTNVARHAQASHILVILTLEHHQLRLQIRDDGQGMSTAPVRTFGITGMRERTTALGGTLRISGGAIGGTTVEMLLPL